MTDNEIKTVTGDKTTETPIIIAENLTKRFFVGKNTITAVNNVSLTVQPKKLTILRGRSGSGKTTLMNLLCGLDEPTEGVTTFGEYRLSEMSGAQSDRFRQKNVGIVFQSVALMSLMNAYENVEFGMRIAGKFSAKERRERTLEALSMVGLSKRAMHMPAEMSGGEQQRVAIARAIAHKPPVLFADEPTAALDSATSLQVMRLFIDLIEKEGTTIVMTTHDQNLLSMADKVYTLQDGGISDVQ